MKKRKIGRPKKRGPKKKWHRPKKKVMKSPPSFRFKIIMVRNGRQCGYVGCYNTFEEGRDVLYALPNTAIFPQYYTNTGNKKGSSTISNTCYEYLLMERDAIDKSPALLRNAFGKMVPHIVSGNDKWTIVDKVSTQMEETFWVYGYDPKMGRKSFTEIYDSILLPMIQTKYDIVEVIVYKNKIIFKNNDVLEIVFCKNVSDAIRFYNTLQDTVKQKRAKQIYFVGSFDKISDRRRKLEQSLIETTGWDLFKIRRASTRS